MAKRYRRKPAEMIDDLRSKIEELQRKQQAREMSKHPSVKVMRLARMHLRKGVNLLKPGCPFSNELVKQSRDYLDALSTRLDQLGTRRPRGSGRAPRKTTTKKRK